ncbi:MAG: response regulator [Lachnospiraceae bacterium]|nr:response regulator [Lachnospiraceae bacterium]
MGEAKKKYDDISAYISDREYTANKYVMKCFSITMLIYTIAFVLNILNIFIVDQNVIRKGYIPSLIIYILVFFSLRLVSLSNEKVKYVLLFTVEVVYTIMSVTITYHVVLVALIPFLCATLYSSKRVMKYIYFITVLSTIITVFGGYYFGLCDANMALLTTNTLPSYVDDGQFMLTEVNNNPIVTLSLFFVVPRCLIYIAFAYVCNSLVRIVSGSVEKAKLTAELERAKEEAENANRTKSQFIAKVSHEIRTPVNAVMGMNEMILRESKEANIKKYAHDVKDSSMALLSIINEILDSSKIESGMMEIVDANYHIGSLLNDLYNMIKVRAKEKDLELIFDIEQSIPSELYGDEKRIRQVLVNLLSNGVKYTEQGTVTLKVTCDIDGENAIIHYSVKDTGIGIKEENIEKIYDAFKRVDVSRNRNVEGTGLGLNIARQFINLMGSELKIQSEYEKGSEFSFDIVQKIISAKPLGDFRSRIVQAEKERDYHTSFMAPKAKILVVDDNRLNLKVFKSLLTQTQIQVYEAESGMQCLDILKKQSFDIVFLDHMMPEMDGIETLNIIKSEKLCDGVPIIVLTANAIIGEREKYINSGFDDFLSKPIIPEKLEQMIMNYLPKELIGQKKSVEEQCLKIKELPELDEFDFDYALRVLQDEELLKNILIDFYHSLETLDEKLSILFDTIDREETLQRYRIEVHGLKSSSATVGALLLSKTARLLEVAAMDKDMKRIYAMHPILISEMKKHRERIATIIPKKEKKEAAGDMGVAYFDMLKISLSNENYDSADFLCNEIQKYQYSDEVEKLVDQLATHVLNLETEEAIKTIDKIKEAMGECT